MISSRMERTVRMGEGQAYASAVTSLWERVGGVLVRLERIAESPPGAVDSELLDELPGLQYRLHAGAELAVGIEPPPGGEAAHADLVGALAEARDATAEVAGALESGDSELVQSLLPEWRGSLFRVRLARLRVLERPLHRRSDRIADAVAREAPPAERTSISAVVATLLVLGGALLFTAGAVLVAWPLWAAGLALFAGGFILYRP